MHNLLYVEEYQQRKDLSRCEGEEEEEEVVTCFLSAGMTCMRWRCSQRAHWS